LHSNRLASTTDSPALTFAARVVWYAMVGIALGRAALVHWPRHRGLYDIYAQAGRNWVAGSNLYFAWDSIDGFRYAPLIAAGLTPLAKLPEILGSFLVRGVNVVVLMAGAFAFLDRVVLVRRESRAAAIYWLVLAALTWSGLFDLQVNALVTGLMLLAVAALPQSRWNFAAICLAGAVLLKIYPIALMLLCILMWPRKLAWRCAVALLVGLAAPLVMQNPSYVWHQYPRWFHLMTLNDRQHLAMAKQYLPLGKWYRDVRLPLGVLGIYVSSKAYLIVQLVAAGLIAAVVAGLRRGASDWRLRLGILYGLAAGWMMAFGPATEGVTYIMLAPAVAWLVVDALWQSHGRAWRMGALTLAAFFAATEASLWFRFGTLFRGLGPQPAATVVLMALLIKLQFSHPADPPARLRRSPSSTSAPREIAFDEGDGPF